MNCAAVLAQQGLKVLLVDADLRRSSLHRKLGISREPGLGDVLDRMCDADGAIAEVSGIAGLSVMSAGRAVAYPAEALASNAMKAAMDRWRGNFDYVVLDTPPVAMVTDAVVLGARTDAVLLVAKASQTTRQALARTRDRLLRANARIAGVVINGVDPKYENSYYHAYGQDGLGKDGYDPQPLA
jgi:capsular exopolysaccharide synthesis family protein